MTEQTRQDLRTLSKLFRQMSYKQGKIEKADLKYPVELIFNIIKRGDFEVQVNNVALSIARGWIKGWLES